MKIFTYSVFYCAFLPILLSAELKKGWALVGNPLLHFRPCKGNDNVIAQYEPGLPPSEENQYGVSVLEEIPTHSKIIIKFDSPAMVTLTNKTVARIYADKEGTFTIRFFQKAGAASFDIKGVTMGVVPYITSLVVNTVEYCEETNVGAIDAYIQGYKGDAAVELSAPDDTCGRRKVQHTELITNGLDTKPGDWPWHSAIYRLEKASLKYICGGTLVSKIFVVTAGHCVSVRGNKILPEVLNVVLGKYNLIGGDIESTERGVHEIIVHPEFSPKNLNNDIALLKLKTEATFNDYVQPACLWSDGISEKLQTSEITGTVVGWGFDSSDQLSNQLKQATMPIVSESACLKSNPLFFSRLLNDDKFCAGFRNGTSACNGDSGGGFLIFIPDSGIFGNPGIAGNSKTGTYHLRGVVSVAVARKDVAICDPDQYVLYTDVSKYGSWLKHYLE